MDEAYNDAACRKALRAMDEFMRAANALPAGDKRELALLTAPDVERRWSHANRRVLQLLRGAAQAVSTSNTTSAPNDADAEAESEGLRPGPTSHDIFAGALDDALERAFTALDAAEAQHKPRATYTDDAKPAPAPVEPRTRSVTDTDSFMRARKPQQTFDAPPDNSDAPFVPPHRAGVAPVGKDVPHPMESEISDALSREKSMAVPQPTLFTDLKEVDKEAWIDTPEALHNMADQLKGERAIAVDLEHHNMRSFMGFTCLLQISTRQRDWVVDTIRLRSHVHHALAGVFEDPKIVKVLHGANSDVTWLERDFGIYVVNMFDTYVAAKALGEKGVALNDLQALYCGFVTSKSDKKKMQRSDWRKRPLSDKELKYARSDTHYLLYIFDRLRQLLFEAKKLPSVLEASANICRLRYVRPAANVLRFEKQGIARGFNLRQLHLLHTLVKWRHEEARKYDEGLGYIMENRVIFEIARHQPQPKSKGDIRKALGIKDGKRLPRYISANPVIARLVANLRKAVDEKLDEEWVKSVEERKKRLKEHEAKKAAAKAAKAAAEKQKKKTTYAETEKMTETNDEATESEKMDEEDDDDDDILSSSTSTVDVQQRAKRKMIDSLTSSACDSPSETESMGSVVVGVLKKAAKNDAMDVRPVVTAGKSVFDLSDSEDDDDDDESPNVKNPPVVGEATPQHEVMQDDTPQAMVDEGESATDSGVHEKPAREHTVTVEAEAATFDLSESEDDADANAARLAEQVRRNIAAEAPVAKEMDLDGTEAVANGDDMEIDEEAEAEPVDEEEVYKPLVERKQKPRRKKMKKNEEVDDEAPVMQPFDYKAASMADNNSARQTTTATPKPFTPFAGLKDTGRRVRRTRKNPGSGSRSMTFRGAEK